jgi:hypothetical protein
VDVDSRPLSLPSSAMSTQIQSKANLTNEELQAILAAAQGNSDRRVDPRHALFTTVTLRPASAPTTVVSAFSREISLSGVGLLHAAPLTKDETYEIEIRIEEVRVRKTAKAIWCRPVGEGWFLSGCRFV